MSFSMLISICRFSFISAFISTVILVLYTFINDRALRYRPSELKAFSPAEWTTDDFEAVEKKLDENPIRIENYLPPKTGRRYIVVGGTGFLGGWIVIHLLKRGESPHSIRIIDLRPPTRKDLICAPADKVEFVQADVSNVEEVEAAFSKPWPSNSAPAEITVFHTAATIRFYDRHPSLLHLSTRINVQGTANVIRASRKVGASVLIATSSGSVQQKRNRLWLIPFWEKMPENFVQVWRDDEEQEKKMKENGVEENVNVEECCTTYSVSKILAERLVREADGVETGTGNGNEVKSESDRGSMDDGDKDEDENTSEDWSSVSVSSASVLNDAAAAGYDPDRERPTSDRLIPSSSPRPKRLQTGCIRPGNSIYGPGTDVFEFFLEKGHDNPSFFRDILSSYVYVENCSLAHLCYEERLLEIEGSLKAETETSTQTAVLPDIGGQAFTVTDPGPPVFWYDIYAALKHFTQGKFGYFVVPATPILLLAHIVEAYSLFRNFVLVSSSASSTSSASVWTLLLRRLLPLLPQLPPSLISVQPSTVNLSLCHIFVDDFRARRGKEVGGLGYRGAWTTLEGLAECVRAYEKNGRLDSRAGRFEGVGIEGEMGKK